jgi:uncharacterized damage-inducible protein DinB
MNVDAGIFLEHMRYHRWASEAVLHAARALPAGDLYLDRHCSHGGIFGTLRHVYQADTIWLARLNGNPQPAAPAPPETIEALEAAWRPVHDALIRWAESQTDWNTMLVYRRLNGEPLENPVWEVALHVVNHGTLHRGQAMGMLRQLGHTPPATDLIFYRRAHPRAGSADVGR